MKLLDIITLKALRNRRREQQSQEEYAAELKQINSTYFRVFNTPDGKYILEHLARTQLTGTIAMQGDNYLDIGEKQGRANLVKEIIQRIERAKIS
jgi:hypothetical protein